MTYIIASRYGFKEKKRMTTAAQKRAIAKYHASPKGRAARKRAQDRYGQSGKGKLAQANYMKTSKAQESIAASRRLRRRMTSPIR